MKFLILFFIASPAFALDLWKKVELPGMVVEIPVQKDGSLDTTRMQRRTDIPAAASARLTPNNNLLWPVTHPWTDADELDYSDWIKQNAREDFFVGSGVLVDCADAAVALRWVYARERGLPAAQTLAGSGKLMGHFASTNEWDALPVARDWRKDERFKAALKYLLDHIYTHSILNDLYPIEITPAYLVPGTISLGLHDASGHTRTFLRIAPGLLEFIFGNLPADEHMYQWEEGIFYVEPAEGGILHFRWPEWVNGQWELKAADKMPGYSTEQYDWGPTDFDTNFEDRLKLWNSLQDQIVGTAARFSKAISERKSVVELGYYLCSLVPCAPGSVLDTEYSTPQRDYRLSQLARTLEKLLKRLDPNDNLFQELPVKYGKPFMPGTSVTVWDLMSEQKIKQFKSNPTTTLFERWNLTATQDLNGFWVRMNAFIQNWNHREANVSAANWFCFPNGGIVPACDPATPEIQELDTTRLDQAFRVDRATLVAMLAQLPAADQASVRADLSGWDYFCFKRPSGTCDMNEVLNTDMIDKMTSSPIDPPAQRYGSP